MAREVLGFILGCQKLAGGFGRRSRWLGRLSGERLCRLRPRRGGPMRRKLRGDIQKHREYLVPSVRTVVKGEFGRGKWAREQVVERKPGGTGRL